MFPPPQRLTVLFPQGTRGVVRKGYLKPVLHSASWEILKPILSTTTYYDTALRVERNVAERTGLHQKKGNIGFSFISRDQSMRFANAIHRF